MVSQALGLFNKVSCAFCKSLLIVRSVCKLLLKRKAAMMKVIFVHTKLFVALYYKNGEKQYDSFLRQNNAKYTQYNVTFKYK